MMHLAGHLHMLTTNRERQYQFPTLHRVSRFSRVRRPTIEKVTTLTLRRSALQDEPTTFRSLNINTPHYCADFYLLITAMRHR